MSVFGALLSATTFSVAAQTAIKPGQDYPELIKRRTDVQALDTSLFGDKTDLYTGATEFVITDVDVPGNNTLPVQVGRRFAIADGRPRGLFGDWDIEIPHMHGVYARTAGINTSGWQVSTPGQPNQRCSVDVSQPSNAGPPSALGQPQNLAFQSYEFWYGNKLYVPGSGDQKLMVISSAAARPTDGATYKWITNSQWVFSCLPNTANGVPGEGFLATSPDGTKYWFDWFAKRLTRSVEKEGGQPPFSLWTRLEREENWILPTKAVDRFGNQVTYTYDAANPARLLSISSSDGRHVELTYNSQGLIATIAAHGQIWTYGYSASGLLERTSLPDTSQWSMNLGNIIGSYTDGERNCAELNYLIPDTKTGTITHPSGAIGTFSFVRRRFGRSYVPNHCMWSGSNSFHLEHKVVPVQSISSKQINGPGVFTPTNLTFEYSPTSGSFESECQAQTCPETSATKVTQADGSWTRYTFSNRFNKSEGKALLVERGDPSLTLENETTSYLLDPSGQPFPATIGKIPCYICSNEEEFLRPITSRILIRSNISYSLRVDSFDEFARPAAVRRGSNISYGYEIAQSTSYHNNLTKWVLGQVAISSSNGYQLSKTDYDSNAMPYRSYRFGDATPTQTLTYNADGTIATVKDGNNNVTTLSNWKRGIPQSIQHPATPESPSGSTQTAQVNDNGWIDWVVDENGYKTSYGYDAMGRVSSIAYPTDDTVPWNSVTRSFVQVNQAEMGIPAGHWRESVTQGNYEKQTFFDALWRPIFQYERDITNNDQTFRITSNAFDHEGRQTFASYPRNPYADGNWAIDTGTRTTYDALGRTIEVKQDSELGAPLVTTTEYLSGGETRVTDPNNQQTRTRYAAWDQPTTDYPIEIFHPEGAITQIWRDYFFKPTQIRRSGTYAGQTVEAIRKYEYDAVHRLCRTDEPETGSTVLGYDYNDNLTWSASGLTTLAATGCEHMAAYQSGRRSDRLYDARNRVTDLSFPDGNGNQHWDYTKDGLPSLVRTWNNEGSTIVDTVYTYNKRRLLTKESLLRPYEWAIGYGYDPNGNLSTQTYPTGLALNYAPNALGQPTQVTTIPGSTTTGTYASGVSYYPNGAIKQFTYGNGIVHTMIQNARQLPQTTQDGSVVGFTNLYDANGNTTLIDDLVQGQNFKRYLSYDGLDRLTAAGSAMFGGTTHYINYAYDPIDNIRAVTHLGVREHTYWYDTKNHLTNVQNAGGASVTGLGYDDQGNLNIKNGQQYGFDYGNRLRWVMGKESYRYDSLGRRSEVIKDDGSVHVFQYSQAGQPLFSSKISAAGVQTTHENVYLSGSVIATIDHNWPSNTVIATKYQHTDALGSPVAVTDTSGALIERTNYEPYGSAINKTIDGIGYTGHVMDGATGLTYMQQRYYDPTLGRFLSVDPVTSDGNTGSNFNRYKYAANNPYRFTDPDGRQEAAYGAGATMFLTPEQRRVWEGGERAATTEGGGSLRGAAMSDGLKQFAAKPELTKENLTQIATIFVLATVSRGRNHSFGLTYGPSPRIHAGQQGKHQIGHNNYQPGKSILTGNPEELGRRAGTGQSINSIEVGLPGSKERVNFGREIGNYVDPTGNATPTTNGIIHYSKNGIHIVPSRPDQ